MFKRYYFDGNAVQAIQYAAAEGEAKHKEFESLRSSFQDFWRERGLEPSVSVWANGEAQLKPGDGTMVVIYPGQWYVVYESSLEGYTMSDDYFSKHTDGAKAEPVAESPLAKGIQTLTDLDTSAMYQRNKTDGFGFSAALLHLKDGGRVARAGWNGKGMWLAIVECAVDNGDFSNGTALVLRGNHEYAVAELNQLPWIGMRTADAGFVPWLASQTDMLAEDWQVVE